MKILTCSSIIKLWLEQSKEEVSELKRLRSESMPQIYDKLLTTVLVKCYKELSVVEAIYLAEDLSNINIKKYINIDIKYYTNTQIEFNLTDEELNLTTYIDKVLLYIT